MRDKVGILTLSVVLVAVWAIGFLWMGGGLGQSDASAAKSAARTQPTASAAAPGQTSPAAPESATDSEVRTPRPGRDLPELKGKLRNLDKGAPVQAPAHGPRPEPQALPEVTSFTMATFNVLGSTHTSAGGKRAGMRSGPARIPGALRALQRHGVSVAGLQEFTPNQRAAFARRAPGWAMYPGQSMGRRAGENSVVWRRDTWELVRPNLIGIPYFSGRDRPMPYVLLRNLQTGMLAWFSTFHNPASNQGFGNQQRHRNIATSREIGLFNRLEGTGIPQFVTGDMNERREYFCRVTGATPLKAAAGGSHQGRCAPPGRLQIDWIFGSPRVEFSGYVVDHSTKGWVSDHPIVVSRVSVDGLDYDKAFEQPAP